MCVPNSDGILNYLVRCRDVHDNDTRPIINIVMQSFWVFFVKKDVYTYIHALKKRKSYLLLL